MWGGSYFESRSQPIPVLIRNLRLGGLAFGNCVQKETGLGGKILGREDSPRFVEAPNAVLFQPRATVACDLAEFKGCRRWTAVLRRNYSHFGNENKPNQDHELDTRLIQSMTRRPRLSSMFTFYNHTLNILKLRSQRMLVFAVTLGQRPGTFLNETDPSLRILG